MTDRSLGLGTLKWAWYSRSRPLDDLSKFDLASRGPWGAVRLLWTLRGRHLVATVGALVTVAALAIDPIAQLLIRYDNCNVQLPSMSAGIPKKNTFSELGMHIGAGYSTLTYGLQSAINTGLFNPEAVNIPYSCATGNCTFNENYHTVGYCSRCTDRSTDLSMTCYGVNRTVSGSSTNGTTFKDTQTKGLQCNTSLPGGFAAMSDMIPSDPRERPQITYFQMGRPTQSGFQDTTLMIAANLSSVYQGDCTTAAENATWSCKNFGAAACELYPCVRSYSASVKNNKFEETLISSSVALAETYTRGRGFMGVATINVGCLQPKDRQSLVDIGYTIKDSMDWLPYRGLGVFGNATDANPRAVAPNVTVPDGCLYQFYTPSIMSIEYFMSQFFNGSITGGKENYKYATSGPVQLSKIFNSGNISFAHINMTFSNVADSMTAYMRHGAEPAKPGISGLEQDNSKPAAGQTFRSDICVHVRWWYLALPIILVALTFAFLIATLVQTERRQSGLGWKSSPLALLFHGLDPDVRKMQGDVMHNDEMTHAAQRMSVQLRWKDQGWLFTDKH